MRVVKVVPTFVNRDFSVPATSNLLPVHAQKRLREINAEHANKRRRVEHLQLGGISEELYPSPDQPIPTTESERSGEDSIGEGEINGAHTGHHSRRSQSGASLVLVHDAQTGGTVFGPGVKEESPELGLPLAPKPAPIDNTFKKPSVPASKKPSRKRKTSRQRSTTPRVPSQESSEQQIRDEEQAMHNGPTEDVVMQEVTTQDRSEIAASPDFTPQEAAIHRSPRPTSEQTQATPPPAKSKSRDIYDVPSSPEFLSNRSKQKPKKMYSRSPRTTTTIQKEVDLLNSSRFLSSHTQNNSTERSTPNSLSKKAHAFQLPIPDEIESTPQEAASQQGSRADSMDNTDMTTAFLDSAGEALLNSTQTPKRATLAETSRPGSLKKPSKTSLLATPSSVKRAVQFNNAETPGQSARARAGSDSKHSVVSTPGSTDSKGKKRDPAIQARLDKLRSQRRTPKKAVEKQSSPQNSVQSLADSRLSGESSTTSKVTKSGSEPVSQSEETPSATTTAVEAGAIPSGGAARGSLQPPVSRTTSMRSPVPLPENVRGLTPNGTTASVKTTSTGDAEVFKKPDLKLWSMKSNNRARGNSSDRRGSGSSDARSTPLRTEVLLVNNIESSVNVGTKETSRRLSGSSDASRTSIRTEVPLPANVRRLSSSTQKPSLLNGNSPTSKKDSPAPLPVPSKRDGSPPKHTGSITTRTPVINSAAKPAPKVKAAKPPVSAPFNEKDADEAIVISSRESTQSDISDSEEDGMQGPSVEALKETSKQSGLEGQQKGPRRQTAGNAEMEQPEIVNSAIVDIEPSEKDMAPWTSQEWGFGGLGPRNGGTDKLAQDARPPVPAPSLSEGDVAGIGKELADPTVETNDRSRSASAAVSTRSSPVVSRRPARFLSHSPTPESSESESESDANSATASKTTPPAEDDKAQDSDSDSSSDSDDSATGDEDTEMRDVPSEPVPMSTAGTNGTRIPSSPPRLTNLSNSTPLVPETSQVTSSQINWHTIHKTPVPLPPPSQLRSSQSLSTQTPTRRPTARYAGFRTLREQLADAQTAPKTAQTRVYDPRTMSLGKLAAKAKTGAVIGGDDESSEEESSSSSSDSD